MAEYTTGWCDLNTDQFPCSEGAITLVSLGLASAGMGLLMVLFLIHQVSSQPHRTNEMIGVN